jgi:hypothetical protein
MDRGVAFNMLLDIREAFRQQGTQFFLTLGTALGAVRDGDLIAFDRDIDVGFLFEELEGPVLFMDRLKALRFTVIPVSAPFKEIRAFKLRRDGVNADLAGYMRWHRKRYCVSSLHDYALVYPADMLERLDLAHLRGEVFCVPSPPEEYLELQYGRTWRVPSKSWDPKKSPARRNHFLKRLRAERSR